MVMLDMLATRCNMHMERERYGGVSDNSVLDSDADFGFLEKFYANLLFGETHVLRERDMIVGKAEEK